MRLAIGLTAAFLVLLGAAGLSTLQDDDNCLGAYDGRVPKRSEGILGRQEWSVWPPGVVCGFDGAYRVPEADLAETGGDATAFVAFVVLAAVLAYLILSQLPHVRVATRAAAAALAGLLMLGLGAWGGSALAAGILAFGLAPLVGYATDRLLQRGRPDANLLRTGMPGAVIATFAVGACSFLWLAGLAGMAGVVTLGAFVAFAVAEQALSRGSRPVPA